VSFAVIETPNYARRQPADRWWARWSIYTHCYKTTSLYSGSGSVGQLANSLSSGLPHHFILQFR